MSHDVKYIGMDVHKEAIVIAVLNGSGKLVMETILETKANSILQFIHGLRGELHARFRFCLRPALRKAVVQWRSCSWSSSPAGCVLGACSGQQPAGVCIL